MSFKQIYNNKEYDLSALTETQESTLGLKKMHSSTERRYLTTINSSSELYSDK
jgi:hypothetical protein